MALALQPTLSEIVAEVLNALGEGGSGVASAGTTVQCQTMARRAQAKLYQEAAWVINRIRFSTVLTGSTQITGTQTIDWPDNVPVGHITRVSATRVSDPRIEWQIHAGITSDDRSTWNFGGFSPSTFTPFKYDFLNGQIELGPVNEADVNIYVQADQMPSPLKVENDRASVDGEAIIRLTEILLRNAIGGEYRQAVPALMSEYSEYLDSIKPKQGSGRTIVPGSQWAIDDPARPSNWVTTRQRHWMWRDRRP